MIVLQDLNSFFKEYGLYMALGVATIIFIVVGFLLLRKPKSKKINTEERFLPFVDALGGIDNIIKSESKISRLVVELLDATLLDEDKLKQLGTERIIKLSKKITLLVGDISIEIQKAIEKQRGIDCID